MKNYLVKIRGGVEVDSAGKKAGKGPLIAEEISHTLGTSQDQYLFQAVEEKSKAIGFMRGLGGAQTMNEKMPTLQAANGTSGNNKPCVAVGVDRYNQMTTGNVMPTLKTPNGGDDIPCVVTFEPGIASRDGGHVYEGVSGTLRATPGDNQMTVAYDIGEARLRNSQEYIEKSPTITARCGTGGNNVPAVVFENHAQDSRYKGPLKVAQPVTATYGMGGNNQPLVICMATQQGGAEILEDKSPTITAAAGMSGNNQPVICLQGNGIDRADTAGCNGKGWAEDVSYTLNTIDRHAVAFGVTTKGNGDAFISKERHTALTNGGGQAGQGYPCVIEVVYPEQTGTLMANSHPGSYTGQDAYNDMLVVETFHCNTEEEKTPPIKARDYKDPLVICYEKTKK